VGQSERGTKGGKGMCGRMERLLNCRGEVGGERICLTPFTPPPLGYRTLITLWHNLLTK